ncbi:hypothetical protein F5Y16DRAFT_421004 [Xylariaceae sp. FL0255]|nr:hypothetical protein F5Y16DRAFT_421004 [Xylariaceae sp. FL0255]
MTQYALPMLYRMNSTEVRHWQQDKSGVAKVPMAGTEDVPLRGRLWFNYELIYSQYLGNPQYMKSLIELFRRNMEQKFDGYPTKQWTEIGVQEFCRRELAEVGIKVLFDPNLIGLTPDFVDRFRGFDDVGETIRACLKTVQLGQERRRIRLGALLWKLSCSGTLQLDERNNWGRNVIAAIFWAWASALDSDSIPTATWMLMEIIQNASLLQSVRDEITIASMTDPVTGKKILDSQNFVPMPLLQSIWIETLRLRINFNITYDVK